MGWGGALFFYGYTLDPPLNELSNLHTILVGTEATLLAEQCAIVLLKLVSGCQHVERTMHFFQSCGCTYLMKFPSILVVRAGNFENCTSTLTVMRARSTRFTRWQLGMGMGRVDPLTCWPNPQDQSHDPHGSVSS